MPRSRKKISMQILADSLNISKNAVFLALNGKPGVSEELRKTVVKKAQDLGYIFNYEKNKEKGNRNILVLIPEYIRYDTYFYNNIYWSVEKEAKDRGYNAVLASVGTEMEQKLSMPNLYYDLDFSGIMIIGVFSRDYVGKLVATKLPVMSVDHYYDDIPLDATVTANEEGAYTMVKHLIDCGHRDIGFVGSIKMSASLFERWCGYNKAMLLNGQKVTEEHCILESSPLDTLLSDPQELEQHVAKLKSFPSAWFCGGDRIAISLINVLAKRGLNVPEDISVAGFDDIDVASLIVPPLTTMRVNRELMGIKAVDFLIARIERNGGDKQKVSVYCDLVLRDSVITIV